MKNNLNFILQTMFSKMNSGATQNGDAAPASKKGTIEKMYQKKSQLEHILLRPDTYIGSVERATENMWVFDKTKECMTQRELTYVPGKDHSIITSFFHRT